MLKNIVNLPSAMSFFLLGVWILRHVRSCKMFCTALCDSFMFSKLKLPKPFRTVLFFFCFKKEECIGGSQHGTDD